MCVRTEAAAAAALTFSWFSFARLSPHSSSHSLPVAFNGSINSLLLFNSLVGTSALVFFFFTIVLTSPLDCHSVFPPGTVR